MNAEEYDQSIEAEEMSKSLEMIDQSMEAIKTGRTRPMKQALKEIAEKLDITIDR